MPRLWGRSVGPCMTPPDERGRGVESLIISIECLGSRCEMIKTKSVKRLCELAYAGELVFHSRRSVEFSPSVRYKAGYKLRKSLLTGAPHICTIAPQLSRCLQYLFRRTSLNQWYNFAGISKAVSIWASKSSFSQLWQADWLTNENSGGAPFLS